MFWDLIIPLAFAVGVVFAGVTKNQIHHCSFNELPCADGVCVSVERVCDGVRDCADGYDETICLPEANSSLARGDIFSRGKRQSGCRTDQWQCRDGGCIPFAGKCDGHVDCSDGSDETDALCKNSVSSACVLPPYPANGWYMVQGQPFFQPGQQFKEAVYINVSCYPNYAVDGNSSRILSCIQGIDLSNYVPKCKRYCTLTPHRSVLYKCKTNGILKRSCGLREFVGTTVVPTCRTPYYRGSPYFMHCTENGWNHIARCDPDCGRLTSVGQEYVIRGKRAKHGEIPWHAGIYSKAFEPYMQICGGSLISTTTVITAAHCFWKDGEGIQPPTDYAVALGKIYRPWNDTHDADAQFSNVSKIHIPVEFHGAEANFQNDIAVVKLETEIEYKTFIRPVCVSFDYGFNMRQLQAGMMGKISGWGLTSANGRAAPVLQVVELPFVTYGQCYKEAPEDFREYITNDKICAGFRNGTALCQGDSGGGLAFPEYEQGVQRYYLRGIVSTAPRSDLSCDPLQRTTFTEFIKHEHFIKDTINPSEDAFTAFLQTPSYENLTRFDSCVLPPYPANGRYEIQGRPLDQPGRPFNNVVYITVSCEPDYAVVGNSTQILPCFQGADLSHYVPQCKRYCTLPHHASVVYNCETRDGEVVVKRPCGLREFFGTTVVPTCRTPYYRGSPSFMHCTENGWNHIARCDPECGRIVPTGEMLIIGGKRAMRGEIPWHAGIYSKTFNPYKQICGGSLVSTTTVVTAAHCFWKDGEGKQPATNYAVALGKIYRPWNDIHDQEAQFSNISEIHIPVQFRGAEANFQYDIAVVKLENEIEYKTFIRPICVHFDDIFKMSQLQAGKLGKISGWGLTSANGNPATVLRVAELSYVPYNQCNEESPQAFREYITSDKFCAGFRNGTALCQGDNGGGLAFPAYERGVQRYYLLGIASTAPRSDLRCDPFQYTTFTDFIKHEHFIKDTVMSSGSK